MIAGSPRSRTPSKLWCVATTTTTTPSSGGVARVSSRGGRAPPRVWASRAGDAVLSAARAHAQPMPGCDVLLRTLPQVPAGQVLQWRERGQHDLRHAVEQSLAPPQLWICGHVHEARGQAPAERGRRAEDSRAERCQRERRPRVTPRRRSVRRRRITSRRRGGGRQRPVRNGGCSRWAQRLRTGAALYDGKARC